LNAVLLPGSLSCYSGMFRAYRREWFSADYLRLSVFTSLEQILVDALLAGAKVVEYPVTLRRMQRPASAMRRLLARRLVAVGGYLFFVTRVWRQSIRAKRGTRPGYAAMGEEVRRRPFT